MRRVAALALALSACGAPATQVVVTGGPVTTLPKAHPRNVALFHERAARSTTTTTVKVRAASVTVERPPARIVDGGIAAILACIRRWESGGNYSAVSPNGRYQGAYQFDASTWRGAVTRAGYPEWANDRLAPPHVQDAAAAQLYSERGLQPWPTPARRCA